MTLLLRPQPLTALAFERYGSVIAGDGHAGRPINHGTSQRMDDMGSLALSAEGGRAVLALFRAQALNPEGPWRELERHRLGTQSFIPLMGARCIVLVALGEDAPDTSTIAAFQVSGRQGFTLNAGTWHHPLIALDGGDFVVIERAAPVVDCEVVRLAEPVRLVLD